MGEGLRLEVGDIDDARGLVHIRNAKGNMDRFVLLLSATHLMLRHYWQVHRNPSLPFPSRMGGIKAGTSATSALDRDAIAAALHQVAAACGLTKKDHATLPAPRLCHTFDRGRCKSARSAKMRVCGTLVLAVGIVAP